jgi:hypothetical protein
MAGTSIFDPTLCELLVRWFAPPGGLVLDPFAGGSVRGIVCARLGRRYVGIDLSASQVEANRAQWTQIGASGDAGEAPQWLVGDSKDLSVLVGEADADFILTCPPYADLEIYSSDPRDISNMQFDAFMAALTDIIAQACARLRQDRFAAIVISDVRDKAGLYRGLPWRTVQAFEAAGLRLYNEAVLVTSAGSLAMRAAEAFVKSRKLGRTHQSVLVFCKGNPTKATEAIGPVEFGEPTDEGEGAPVQAIGGEV